MSLIGGRASHSQNLSEPSKNKTGERCRSYESDETSIASVDITLQIRGTQYADGRVEGRIGLRGDGLGDLHPETVRQPAAALLAAVDRRGP